MGTVTLRYDLTPNPKVRMTRRDTWGRGKVRPAVEKWRLFQDAVQGFGIRVLDGDEIEFVLPIPASWNATRRRELDGQPHRQKPDLDNLLGGLFDAAHPQEDKHIAELRGVRKIWGHSGAIVITRKNLPDEA